MNALGQTIRDLTGALDTVANPQPKPVPKLNIAPIVNDFGGDIQALASICRRISDAAYGSRGEPVKASEFEVLKAFVAHADGDFALIGICRRDTAVDQQHSPDESHYLDKERL